MDRRVGGARDYLADVVERFERHGWHWAFYAYRSDGDWGGLDYELGTAPLGGAYWKAVEAGADTRASSDADRIRCGMCWRRR